MNKRLIAVENLEAIRPPLVQTLRRPQELRRVRSVVVASYNVYNLFGTRSDRPKDPAQVKALAQVILGLGADVLALEEVQSEAAVRELFVKHVNPKLDARDKYDGFVCIPANDPRGINVALVTRLSIRGAMTFHDREFGKEGRRTPTMKFSRDLLGVRIQMTPNAAHTYTHFVAHLKSKIGAEAAAEKRGVEATEVVNILAQPTFGTDVFIDQDILLSGDMNDDPPTVTITTLKARGRLADAFAAVKPNFTYPTLINASKSGKRKYKETRLDYMFASRSLAGRLTDLRIHRDPVADAASDHYPMSARITLA